MPNLHDSLTIIILTSVETVQSTMYHASHPAARSTPQTSSFMANELTCGFYLMDDNKDLEVTWKVGITLPYRETVL